MAAAIIHSVSSHEPGHILTNSRQAGVATLPRVIGSPVEAPPDPQLAGLLRDAAAQGYERGRQAGFSEGRDAAASQVPVAVGAAFEEGLRALARWQQAEIGRAHV